jgi:hypothetical protein
MFDTSLMISTLRQGKTGDEILRILDAITAPASVMQTVKVLSNTISAAVSDTETETDSYNKPTLDPVEF